MQPWASKVLRLDRLWNWTHNIQENLEGRKKYNSMNKEIETINKNQEKNEEYNIWTKKYIRRNYKQAGWNRGVNYGAGRQGRNKYTGREEPWQKD